MPVTVELLGAEEMKRVMRKLPDQLQRNVLSSVARAGARELQRVSYAHLALALSNRSPRAEDVVIRQRRDRSGDVRAIFDVGPPRRSPELRWLHDGTQPHLISASIKYGTRRGILNVAYGSRAGKVLSNLRTFFGSTVEHPGQPSRPWLKTATFAAREGIAKQMARQLTVSLPKQVQKLVSSEYRSAQLRKFFR